MQANTPAALIYSAGAKTVSMARIPCRLCMGGAKNVIILSWKDLNQIAGEKKNWGLCLSEVNKVAVHQDIKPTITTKDKMDRVRPEVANQGEAHVRCRVEPRNRTRGSLVNGLAQISESVHCKCNLCKYTNTTDLTGVPDFLPVHIYATSANMQHYNTNCYGRGKHMKPKTMQWFCCAISRIKNFKYIKI